MSSESSAATPLCPACGDTKIDCSTCGYGMDSVAYTDFPAEARLSGSQEGERTTGASKPSIGTAKPTDLTSSLAGSVVRVTFAEAEAALRGEGRRHVESDLSASPAEVPSASGLGSFMRSWLRRRWRCFREGHRWHLDPIIPGPNYCERCGRLVEW